MLLSLSFPPTPGPSLSLKAMKKNVRKKQQKIAASLLVLSFPNRWLSTLSSFFFFFFLLRFLALHLFLFSFGS